MSSVIVTSLVLPMPWGQTAPVTSNAIFTSVMSSEMVTVPSSSQSPTQASGVAVGDGVAIGVAVLSGPGVDCTTIAPVSATCSEPVANTTDRPPAGASASTWTANITD